MTIIPYTYNVVGCGRNVLLYKSLKGSHFGTDLLVCYIVIIIKNSNNLHIQLQPLNRDTDTVRLLCPHRDNSHSQFSPWLNNTETSSRSANCISTCPLPPPFPLRQ